MRILSLNYEYPPLGGGGGKVTESLNDQLSKLDNQIITLTSYIKGQKKVNKENPNNIIFRVHSLRKNIGFSNTFEKIGYIISAIYNVGTLIKNFKPEIVHCHFAVPTGFVAYYIKKRYKIPYILTSHGGDVPGFTPKETGIYFKYFNWLFKPIWRNATEISTVSQGVANLIKNSYKRNPIVIHNGIKVLDYQKSVIKSEEGTVNLLFAGRLNKQKNIGFLIDALSYLKNDNWMLTIAGDGPELKIIKQKIHKYNLNKKINLLGWIDSKKIKQLLSKSDILCLTSENEGLPIIGLESLASGLAVIGLDNYGINDIIENEKNGFLINPKTPENFAKYLDILLQNQKMLNKMKDMSFELSKNFEWEKITQSYIKLFIKTLSAWDIGKNLFGKYSSGKGNLSQNTSKIVATKIKKDKKFNIHIDR